MALQTDDVDPNSAKLVGENQLKKYVGFMGDYSKQLYDIEDALGCQKTKLWDKRLNPVMLLTAPVEKISLPNLVRTDNKILNKVLIALSSLCTEILKLEKEAVNDFYDPLLFYGEGVNEQDESQSSDGNQQLQIGRMLPLMQRISCFAQRCREVLKNTIQQLAALHNKTLPQVINTSHVHFIPVFEHICILFRVLITLDEIIASNSILRNDWAAYKLLMKSVHHNPDNFGVDASKLKSLDKLLHHLENQQINCRLFHFCCNQDFDDSGIPVSKNTSFSEEFNFNMKQILSAIEPKIGDSNESNQRLQYVGLCGLFAFNYSIFHSLDRKLFRQLWDVQKKLPCVFLSGHVTFFPDDFFARKMPATSKAVDGKMKEMAEQSRSSWLSSKAQAIPRECQLYHAAVNNWLVKFSSAPQEDRSLDDLVNKAKIFREGIFLADNMRHTIETVMNLHANIGKPMTTNEVLSLFRIMALCKAITGAYHKHSVDVSRSSLHIVQHIQMQILTIIQVAKKKVKTDKKYSERRLDILSALVLCEQCLSGPPTLQRLVVSKLALSVANQLKIFREEDISTVLTKMERLHVVGAVGVLESSLLASDQSSFYWHKTVFSNYLDGLLQDPTDASRLHYVFSALEDCVVHINRVKHLDSPQLLLESYKNEIFACLKQRLLDKICKEIEKDLRLSVHTHLQLDDRNPFKIGIKSLRQLLSIQPIRFLAAFIDVKGYVTHYLDQTFYNLTTVALHDWRTYGEMRNLAFQKYQLEMQEVHLPNQQLEQGLDVLEIMRNIHVFVSKYLYNLNNQIFVESSSNNKHLNTINIRHIANSIRTHGTGIMNTTVNFTFQFLKKKFFIFSQFLFDEHIKSRLIKDIRDFKENRETYHQMFPYEKADRFNRGIRKLGLSQDGSSYLDQFRILISQIGNAMGYIRMVRSGGLHCCSNAIRFVPDLEDIINFEEFVKEEKISSEVEVSFSQFDAVINSLAKNSAEGSDYLHMLVDVFAPEFRDAKNMHLRNFYIIIPPLTLNFVEYIISCKEKMSKKNKVGAAFTDDGFAMGLAYILKLLDQYAQFDALHWFQSVRRKYDTDFKSQQSEGADSKSKRNTSVAEEEKLQQTKALALKRINIYQREFDLLFYSLSSARIFFRADLTAKEEKVEEGDAKSGDGQDAESSTTSANSSNA